MAELLGRFGAYSAKLTGQPAAYVVYFMFSATYITCQYQGRLLTQDFCIIFYLLTGWFFAKAVTWQIQDGENEKLLKRVKTLEKEISKWESA